MPTPISNVVGNTPTLASWGNAVADAVNEILADIYDVDDLAIPWASLTGVPATFAPTAHATAHATAGADPITPASIGAWKKNTAGGGAAGGTIWVGTTDPAGAAAEGDVWIKG